MATLVFYFAPEAESGEEPGNGAGDASPGGMGQGEDGPLDAFAGGFPVPPLPGQVLPPSPRARGTAPSSTASATALAGTPTTPASGAEAQEGTDD